MKELLAKLEEAQKAAEAMGNDIHGLHATVILATMQGMLKMPGDIPAYALGVMSEAAGQVAGKCLEGIKEAQKNLAIREGLLKPSRN